MMYKGKKKKSNNISVWQRYLTVEIGIEFKACLYFFCLLFFYSIYRIIGGSFEASIIHMAEMIFTTYVMGYVQVFLMSNFDESERLRAKEIIYIIICSFIYVFVATFTGWFDRRLKISIIFFFFMIFVYICSFLICKIKRDIDAKILNEDLKSFQRRNHHERSE
ncbi:MAG: DUF3021 family protein [Coprococcus sp.]